MAQIPILSRVGVIGHALVDDADLPLVEGRRWYLNTHGYVVCNPTGPHVGPRRHIMMHRLITAAPKGTVVDHRNHDRRDNRRENLRVCTPQQNQFNRQRTRNRALPNGVRIDRKKYIRAHIMVDGRTIHLGTFPTIEAAAEARRAAELQHFGEFASAGG